MKKTLLLLFVFALQASLFAQPYFPEGTKWTEIRLDTLKYDSWYSKIDGEWVPNFETIEYSVKGDYTDKFGDIYKCVYTNGPEWVDSLTILIRDGDEGRKRVHASVLVREYDSDVRTLWPGETYQFDWSVGTKLYYQEILGANATCFPPCDMYYYGVMKEIKEGDFGGVRPLKYVDLDGKAPVDTEKPWISSSNGGRIIYGIGITEWNDGECLFGPSNLYSALSMFNYGYSYPGRHYLSMLVHFERDGEVLYDVWPQKEKTTKIVSPLNPSDKEMVNVKSSNRKLFDLQGRRIDNSKLPRGIYIENGKKIVR
ncbi:MAG: hypothetical protein K6G92_03010 [Bacteroidaceae bacterium]|nr:hypothetical protein [Bacteroidaceae bacterium]